MKKVFSVITFFTICFVLGTALFYLGDLYLPQTEIEIEQKGHNLPNQEETSQEETSQEETSQEETSQEETSQEEEPNSSSQNNKQYFLPLYEEKRSELISNKTSFLEIDLSNLKVKLYANGLVQKEASILTQGDKKNWGGTAAGVYKIVTGYRSAYSLVSEVYMPWALQFYGKYYLHGEPFYPGGAPLISQYSGGCLRLKDSDAKDFYEMTSIDMPVLSIDKPRDSFVYPEKELSSLPQVSAESFLVADLDSGFVLAEKNSQQQLPIASLTKLMTAVVLAENIDLTRSITITQEMLDSYGDTEGLEPGRSFRVVQLFYPLLIESSNDAAEILSRFLGRKWTISLMNQKAKALMMTQTQFTCPSGFDCGNLSTVKDLFYLARYLFNVRPPLLEITKGNMVRTFGSVGFDLDSLWNKNVFINDPTFIGGKTGFIKASRYTAIFLFRLTTSEELGADERPIVIIVLGSENEELDTQLLYRWLLDNYFQLES